MGSVLTVVARHERQLVRAHAHQLHRAASRMPGVSWRLRRRACVQVAAIAPHLVGDRLSLLLRHALWSYWLDNRLDAPGIDLAEAARLRAGVAAVIVGGEVCPTDPLLAELAHIVCGLSRYDPTGHAVAWYGESLREALAAEISQLRARLVTGSRPAPTAEQYLVVASQTVNYRSFANA
jgi:hypothetical protein